MWLITIFLLALTSNMNCEFLVNISSLQSDSFALPSNGFQPSTSTSTSPIKLSLLPEPLPAPSKQVSQQPEQLSDRMYSPSNEIHKGPNFLENTIGIPLSQQTHTETQEAVAQAAMQIAQTIVSQIQNQAYANDRTSSETMPSEELPWMYSQSKDPVMAEPFPMSYEHSSSSEPSHTTYITYPYKMNIKKYGHQGTYHHHEPSYDSHSYQHHQPHYDPYQHHEYQHDKNKFTDVVKLFKDFKDEAAKQSHNLGKKIAEESKQIAHKLGPIVPVATTLFVGSLALKLLGSGKWSNNYFNKYNSTYPLVTLSSGKRRRRRSNMEKVVTSYVLVFEKAIDEFNFEMTNKFEGSM